MNITDFLGSASIGALLALLAKELFGWLHEERKHTLELKKRYFDRKLDVTLKTIDVHQRSLGAIKSTLLLITNKVNNVSASMIQGHAQELEKMKNSFLEKAKNIDATLEFFYDERITNIGEKIIRLYESLPLKLTPVITLMTKGVLSAEDKIFITREINGVQSVIDELQGLIRTGIDIAKKDFIRYKC